MARVGMSDGDGPTTLRAVDVLACSLDEWLDRPGFHHAAVTVGERLGARRLAVVVYEADAGIPIWPYHYHLECEEWLYVITGTPALRDPGGERALRAGDLVCCPSGHRGAHAIKGPGRFLLISSDAPGPYLAVYPDSDKIAMALPERDGLNTIALSRATAVDYWLGEGDPGAPVEPVVVVREPAAASRPVVNALDVAASPLGPAIGAERLDAAVLDLAPGESDGEYRCAYGREELLLVLAGAVTVRRPGGEDVLRAGALTCFPEGPGGARRLANDGDEVVRALVIGTAGFPVNVRYPDSGRWAIRNGPDAAELPLRGGDG